MVASWLITYNDYIYTFKIFVNKWNIDLSTGNDNRKQNILHGKTDNIDSKSIFLICQIIAYLFMN